MILFRLVFAKVLGWTALAAIGAAGVIWMAGTVESVGEGAALMQGLREIPQVLVPLSPVLAALGASLALARMMALREDLALATMGVSPLRAAAGALAVGLLLGALQWTAAAFVVHRSVDHTGSWVWLDDGTAHRVGDGLTARIEGGAITSVERRDLDEAQLSHAAMLLSPETASRAALVTATARPARVERQARAARVLSCVVLALVGWLPLARSPGAHVMRTMGVAIALFAGSLLLRGFASFGHVGVHLATWGPPLALGLGIVAVNVRR